MGIKDLFKAFADPEKREEIAKQVVTALKEKKAAQATAECIIEGLKASGASEIASISPGDGGLLPLKVEAATPSGTAAAEPVTPAGADYDYPALCADFNAEAEAHPEIIPGFIDSVRQLLCQSGCVIKEDV